MNKRLCILALLLAMPALAAAQPRGYGYGYGGYGVSRNGPPSQAAQMQQQQSDAFSARASQWNQPSPALRYQQAPPSRRYDSLQPSASQTPIVQGSQQGYQAIPESERHPFVEEHYPVAPEWRRPPYWIWERAPLQ